MFADLKDAELAKEFGEDIGIETDCEKVLPGKYDFPKLEALKKAIFEEVKLSSTFQTEILATRHKKLRS